WGGHRRACRNGRRTPGAARASRDGGPGASRASTLRLPALPLRRALLEDRPQALDTVLAGERRGEGFDLEPEARLERRLDGGAGCPVRLAQRHPRPLRPPGPP